MSGIGEVHKPALGTDDINHQSTGVPAESWQLIALVIGVHTMHIIAQAQRAIDVNSGCGLIPMTIVIN
jgi:hypothetical protein